MPKQLKIMCDLKMEDKLPIIVSLIVGLFVAGFTLFGAAFSGGDYYSLLASLFIVVGMIIVVLMYFLTKKVDIFHRILYAIGILIVLLLLTFMSGYMLHTDDLMYSILGASAVFLVPFIIISSLLIGFRKLSKS